jgi:FlaA1/EpsC-like NDP-sugar epimerase
LKNTKNNKVFEKISKAFPLINTGFSFKNLGYLPRWLVLSMDFIIVFVSIICTYFLLLGLKFEYIPKRDLGFGIAFWLCVNVILFWVFRTYSGIIRHSSFIDAIKLFLSQFSTFAVILVFNFICILLGEQKLFLTTGAFINTVLSFSVLFFYRIIVKQLFDNLFNESPTTIRINAVIYGSGANAIAVANALISETPKRFNLIGFIDKNNQNFRKRLLNLPIFKIRKNLLYLMKSKNGEALIIADNTLTKEERLLIIEECIEFGIKVFTLPSITDWEDKKEISQNLKNLEINDLLERDPIILDTQGILAKMNNKTILVTGAAGSIGSEIVRQIVFFNPEKIILLDQAETPLNSLSLEIISLNIPVEVINKIADIRSYKDLESIFISHKPDVVFHAAAYKHVPMMEENPSQAIFTNVLGTKNIADLSNKYEVDRFVLVSTDKAVNPSSIMGASKRIAEMYVQSKQSKHQKNNPEKFTKFITTRFGNVLGSNGSVVPLFTKQIKEGGPITITHPDIIRYFMTIPEACQLVLEACSMGEGGEIYIFDMGKPLKIIDLAKKMIQLAGFTPDKEIKLKIIGLRPGEKLYEELLNNSAKSIATHHEKIMIAIEGCDEFQIINQHVEELIQIATVGNLNQLVSKMKTIVPEYKSLNSVYQILDVELKETPNYNNLEN